MKKLALVIILSACYSLQAQTNTRWQAGAGVRLTIDILYAQGHSVWFNWRLGVSGGIAYNMQWGSSKSYYRPSFHADLVGMQGGIGTKDIDALKACKYFKRPANGFLALTFHPVQYGYDNIERVDYSRGAKGKPLYYFSDFTFPVLTNPNLFSASLGTTFALNFRENKVQRVSDFSVSAYNVSFIYTNDGPPFAFGYIMGDKDDRWFTGGGILNYHNSNWVFDNLEFSFNKFTGFSPASYQTSTALYLSEVSYNNPEQNKYNCSLLSLRALSSRGIGQSYQGSFGFGINVYDWYRGDIQHRIHYNGYYAHHISPNPLKIGLTGYGQFFTNAK